MTVKMLTTEDVEELLKAGEKMTCYARKQKCKMTTDFSPKEARRQCDI